MIGHPIAELDSDDAGALDRKIEVAQKLFADRGAWLKTRELPIRESRFPSGGESANVVRW